MNIQTAIRKMLKRKGLNQSQLAALLASSNASVSDFLNRQDGISLAERIFPLLAPCDLVEEDPPAPVHKTRKKTAREG